MSDELPKPPSGITLMSPQEFLGRKAAPSETPLTVTRGDGVPLPDQAVALQELKTQAHLGHLFCLLQAIVDSDNKQLRLSNADMLAADIAKLARSNLSAPASAAPSDQDIAEVRRLLELIIQIRAGLVDGVSNYTDRLNRMSEIVAHALLFLPQKSATNAAPQQ